MRNRIIKKVLNPTANLIKKVAIFGANSASIWGTYQPVEPKELRKYKK